MSSETQTLVSILERVERRPEMFCINAAQRDAVAFLMGLDAAHGLGLLEELRPWLLERFGLPQSHRNLAWPALIARQVCPESWDVPERTAEDEVAIFLAMFRLTREFLASTGRDRVIDAESGERPEPG